MHQVANLQEFKALIAGDKVVVVDFTATWCGPCKRIAPVFQELAGKYPNAVFTKVDVDELADIASDQGIEAMPTFRIFKAGKQIFEMRGADPAGLSKACAEHCA